jgi:hypothetical protein
VFPVRYELNLYMLCRVYPHKLAITSPTSGGRSVGIVRSRTQTMEFSFSLEESRPTTEMYCVSCEVQPEFIYVMQKKVDRLCALVVRVPGYRATGPGSIPGATTFSVQ